jgi:hypothetical protein
MIYLLYPECNPGSRMQLLLLFGRKNNLPALPGRPDPKQPCQMINKPNILSEPILDCRRSWVGDSLYLQTRCWERDGGA